MARVLLSALPRRLKVRHRLITACGITPVVHAVWNAGRDRPEPGRVPARRVRPHDAADEPVAVRTPR
jgi:hypothetical protein